jgi:hypothetical protein
LLTASTAIDFWIVRRSSPEIGLAVRSPEDRTSISGRFTAPEDSSLRMVQDDLNRFAISRALDFIQEFGFVLRGLQPKIDQSCIATILLLPSSKT